MSLFLTVEELGAALEESLEKVAHGGRIVVLLDGEPAALILNPSDPLASLTGASEDETV